MNNIKGYNLVNTEKVDRALNGTQKADGSFIGGVGSRAYFDTEASKWLRDGNELGEKEISTLELSLLAEYDRIGGLIVRGTDKVKTGSFYDFKAKTPRSTPKVIFIFNVNGRFVEVPDGTELPGEVKAAKIIAEEVVESEDKPKKVKRTRK